MERGRGRGGGGLLPLLALQAAAEYCRLERKPPVTAGLVAANTLIYLRPAFLRSILPSIDEVWFNAHLILKHRDLKRFYMSAFYHVGESHLVYNMLSLLWKGIRLENSMGSTEFASMVAVLLTMSQGITLLLAKSLVVFFDYKRPFYSEYAVGFSGVLFAMKVVLNSSSGNYTDVQGIIVPTRYAAWAELLLIQMFVPGVSFLGHLGGILAGILYLRLKSAYSGPDPLTRLLGWPVRLLTNLFPFRRRGRIHGQGVSGRNETSRAMPYGTWRCQACTYDNSSLVDECEMCGTTWNGNGQSRVSEAYDDDDLSIQELRRRRIERFSR